MHLRFSLKLIVLSLFFISHSQVHAAAKISCVEIFASEWSQAEFASRPIIGQIVAQKISHEVSSLVEVDLAKKGFSGPQTRGYAILIGAMVGSAALTTYLGSHLSPDLQFLSIFIAQVSTLGVYVVGAPIWEPLSSRFRQMAFGIGKDSSLDAVGLNPQLEATWLRTQENYSLNAQMSRNIITQFIVSVKQNFYEAQRAYSTIDNHFSADQVAEAAFRLRILFKEISPDDVSVVAAINSAFTNHIVVDSTFVELVWSKIRILDPNFDSVESRQYYRLALESWLKMPVNEIPDSFSTRQ